MFCKESIFIIMAIGVRSEIRLYVAVQCNRGGGAAFKQRECSEKNP